MDYDLNLDLKNKRKKDRERKYQDKVEKFYQETETELTNENRNYYLHLKSGGVYEILMYAVCENTLRDLVVYKGTDQVVWTRTVDEFFDGRFVLITNVETDNV
jgi:hypothetical protein